MVIKRILLVGALCWMPFSVAQTEEPPEAVEHLAQAIRIPTVSFQDQTQIDSQAFRDFRQFMQNTYPEVFSQLQVKSIAEHSVLLTWKGRDSSLKPVLFDAHYDVVPIERGTESEWSHPPFAGIIDEGYLWGRGALDDKVTVITTLEAIAELLKSGFQPERTLVFSFAHDEEIGGEQGATNIARYLKDRYGSLEFMVGEGGVVLSDNPFVPELPVAMVGLAEKTYVTLTLSAKGEGGHSSTPVDDNAIVRLAKAVTVLHENPFDPNLAPPVTDMLATLGEHVGGVQGFLMRNQWLSSPLLTWTMSRDRVSNALVRSTTAVTMFNAGIKENVISQKAEAKVNFRLLPGVSPEALIEDVKDIIDDPAITVTSGHWIPGPPVSDADGVGFQRVASAIQKVLPSAVVTPSMLTATTDTAHYVGLTKNIYRFHPYTLPMEDVGKVHGTDERIAIDSVETAVDLSVELIKQAAF
ncbi:M20/M25/M40 family metallo-hydrolase [Pseudomaricurvus sp.]|uniref:M20/M25/M40 family metallo-hydrolase n=1 Tax=Pseudomaricurvus sp. TaxID=2004510 RepID=UPI003F6AF30C